MSDEKPMGQVGAPLRRGRRTRRRLVSGEDRVVVVPLLPLPNPVTGRVHVLEQSDYILHQPRTSERW
jgi:hypothetical protein